VFRPDPFSLTLRKLHTMRSVSSLLFSQMDCCVEDGARVMVALAGRKVRVYRLSGSSGRLLGMCYLTQKSGYSRTKEEEVP
jgi:hypothetical protein